MVKALMTKIEEGGLLVVKISGHLGEKEAMDLSLDIGNAQEIIERAYDHNGQKLRALVDITDFSGEYIGKTMELMASFAGHNKNYIESTAVFGGNDKAVMAGEAVIALSERDNFRFFPTESEARVWLNSQK